MVVRQAGLGFSLEHIFGASLCFTLGGENLVFCLPTNHRESRCSRHQLVYELDYTPSLYCLIFSFLLIHWLLFVTSF